MRLNPGDEWLPFNARQIYSIRKPGLLWSVDVGQNALVRFNGRDLYQDGSGQMLIKLYGWLPLVSASGPQIDRGTLLRYLAEIIWHPQAVQFAQITWQEIDPLNIQATLSNKGQVVSGIFTFSENALPVRFKAHRYYDKSGREEPWLVEFESYHYFSNRYIPKTARISWELKSGVFYWYNVTIDTLYFE